MQVNKSELASLGDFTQFLILQPFNKKFLAWIFPSAYFPSEFDIMGVIKRKQVTGKQLGIGIEFVA